MNQQTIDLLERVDRDGVAFLPPILLSAIESELVGNAYFVNPHEPLMHYMSLTNFMKILFAEQLHMSRLDTFKGDPIEGLYPEANKHKLSNIDAALFKQMGAPEEIPGLVALDWHQRQSAYIHCWFGGVVENKSMWDMYGDQGSGVCLRTTANKLKHAVKSSADLLIDVCGVTYLDEETPIPATMGSLPLCRKQKKFKDENEFRLIAQIKSEALPLDADGCFITPEISLLVPVNLETLLEALVVGPNFDKAESAKLEAEVSKKISSKIIRLSELPSWAGGL